MEIGLVNTRIMKKKTLDIGSVHTNVKLICINLVIIVVKNVDITLICTSDKMADIDSFNTGAKKVDM